MIFFEQGKEAAAVPEGGVSSSAASTPEPAPVLVSFAHSV